VHKWNILNGFRIGPDCSEQCYSNSGTTSAENFYNKLNNYQMLKI